MRIYEYGNNKNEVIIFLHGGGLSWWNYKEIAELLQYKYHLILPVLDGHAESDRDFVSIEENAIEIIKYIDDFYNGKVYAIGGLSLGAQILVEVLSQRKNICKYAVIESALVMPMGFTHRIIGPVIAASYGLIRKKWFARMQFDALKIKACYFNDYYQDTCKITKKNMISFLRANTKYSVKNSLQEADVKAMILVGSKENNKMLSSARYLNKELKGSTMIIKNGFYHGDISLNYAKEYVSLLDDFFQ